MSFAYWIEDAYRFVAEPTCTTPPLMDRDGNIVAATESWPAHPWVTDADVPTVQTCPRCGARRLRVPAALATSKPGPAPRRLYEGFDEHGEPIPIGG